VARLPLFEKTADYAAFLRVVADALDECRMRIFALVLLSTHWHFVLWPEHDDDLIHFRLRLGFVGGFQKIARHRHQARILDRRRDGCRRSTRTRPVMDALDRPARTGSVRCTGAPGAGERLLIGKPGQRL
jgi:hypothetical protein